VNIYASGAWNVREKTNKNNRNYFLGVIILKVTRKSPSSLPGLLV
jgi:hypothetical protein